jgi:hypothetical protein
MQEEIEMEPNTVHALEEIATEGTTSKITRLLDAMIEVRRLCRELEMPELLDICDFGEVVQRCTQEVQHMMVTEEFLASFKNKSVQ